MYALTGAQPLVTSQPLPEQEEGPNTTERTQDTAFLALGQRNEDSETKVRVLVGQKTEESTSTEEHTSIKSPPTEENVESETEEYPDVVIHEGEGEDPVAPSDEVEEKLAALEEEIEALKKESAEKDEKNKLLRLEKQKSMLETETAVEQYNSLKKELEAKIREYETLKAEKEGLDLSSAAKNSEMEKDLVVLRGEVEGLKKELEDQKAILASKDEKIAHVEHERAGSSEVAGKAQAESEALKKRVEELTSELEAKVREHNALKAENEALGALKVKSAEIGEALVALKAEVEILQKQLEDKKAIESKEELKDGSAEESKELEEIRSKLEAKEAEHGALKAELEARNADVKRLAGEKDAEREEKVKAEAANAGLKKELEGRGERIGKLSKKKGKIKNNLGVANGKLDTSNRQLGIAHSQLDTSNRQLDTANSALEEGRIYLAIANRKLKEAKKAKSNVFFRTVVASTSAAGYVLVTNLSSAVRAVANQAPLLMKTTYTSTIAGASYLAGTVPGQFIVTKSTAASSWVASTSAGQWVSSSVYPVVAAKVSIVVSQAMIHGKSIAVQTLREMRNVTVLNNVSPVYGAIFTTAVSLLALIVAGSLKRNFGLSDNHDFTLITLTHTVAGATLYGVSVGLVKAGVTTAAMTASGAAVLTTAALASFLFVRAIQSR